MCSDRQVLNTFENDLQLVEQHFESANAGSILRDQVLLIPRAASELEKVLARVGRLVHGQ
jgi:hypothetical protein